MVLDHIAGEWLTCLWTPIHVTKIHAAIITAEKWYLCRPSFSLARCFEVIILGYFAGAVLLKVFLVLAHAVVAEALACIGTTLVWAGSLIVHAIFMLQHGTYVVVLVFP